MNRENIIGRKVKHKTYGNGIIESIENNYYLFSGPHTIYVTVKYANFKKQYRFPNELCDECFFTIEQAIRDEIETEYIQNKNNLQWYNISQIKDTEEVATKCGHKFLWSADEQVCELKEGKVHCKPTYCPKCKKKMKPIPQERTKSTIEILKQENEMKAIESLMYQQNPKKSKKKYIHDTDGMNV